MFYRCVAAVFVVAVLALGGWLLAGQEKPASEKPTGDGSRFAVAAGGDRAVLLETTSGKTWVLHRSAEGQHVWLPARRLDTDEEAQRWRAEERHHHLKRQQGEEEVRRQHRAREEELRRRQQAQEEEIRQLQEDLKRRN